MLWRELVASQALIGRDIERNHRGERHRGPIKYVEFSATGELTITCHWQATTFDFDDIDTQWEATNGDCRLVLPITAESVVKSGVVVIERHDAQQPLKVLVSTSDNVVIHPVGENISKPREQAA